MSIIHLKIFYINRQKLKQNKTVRWQMYIVSRQPPKKNLKKKRKLMIFVV